MLSLRPFQREECTPGVLRNFCHGSAQALNTSKKIDFRLASRLV